MQQVHVVSRQVGMQLSWPMVSDRTQVCGCPEQHRALSSPTRMHAALCRSPQPCARSHGHASPATAWKRLWLLLKSLLSSLRCHQRPWPRLSLQTSKALIPVTHNNTIGHLLVGFMAGHAAETAANITVLKYVPGVLHKFMCWQYRAAAHLLRIGGPACLLGLQPCQSCHCPACAGPD